MIRNRPFFSFVLLILFAVFPHSFAKADSWGLQISAFSRHRDAGFNENNPGLGLQYTSLDGRLVRRYMAGTLINSMEDRSWYAGAELGYKLFQWLDVGVVGGLITYPSAKESVLLALLPMMTIGTERIAVNVVYIPHIANKTHAAALFQLSLGF